MCAIHQNIIKGTLVKFLKCSSENSFIKCFGWSVMENSNLIIYIKPFNENRWCTKCFFVSSHAATSNHIHYRITNSGYMNKYSLHVQTQPMLVGALDDGRKAVKLATDYFLKAHTAQNEFYVQVGRGDLDHAFWGRPEDMMMARPAYQINTSRPGKLASRSFFLTSKPQLSSGESTTCAKCHRHSHFWHLHIEEPSQTLWFQALYSPLLYSKAQHSLTSCRILNGSSFFTALKIASCNLKGPIWPARQPPPSLPRPLYSRMSTSFIPTTCSHTPSSFSNSPTIIAENTANRSPTPGISTSKRFIFSTQFA